MSPDGKGEDGSSAPTAAQSSAFQHITSCASRFCDGNVQTPAESFREILGGKHDYSGSQTTVEDYDSIRVSLPDGQVRPVSILSILRSGTSEFLSLEHILADDDVVQRRRDEALLIGSSVSRYTDVVLRDNKKEYVKFLRRLYDCGLLGFSKNTKSRISPFFVGKKKNRLRLVLDCREMNMLFRRPPRPDLGTGDCFAAVEPGPHKQLYMGQADIENCFYQCGVPADWSEYMAFDDVDVLEILGWGATKDVHGNPLPTDGVVAPVLLALPMGWSWSFWIVQKLREQLIAEDGFDASRCVVCSWPCPSLDNACVAAPYCDNLTVIGGNEDEVNQHLKNLIRIFENKGFKLHDIEFASLRSQALGKIFDGGQLRVMPRLERVQLLQAAFRHVAGGAYVSGEQIEVLIGHYISEALIFRPALAVLRALYSFVTDSYHFKQPLWMSCRREALIVVGILPLFIAPLGQPWCERVVVTDASPTGWGICQAVLPPEQVREIGKWNERWRFKRLDPSEWAPP